MEEERAWQILYQGEGEGAGKDINCFKREGRVVNFWQSDKEIAR